MTHEEYSWTAFDGVPMFAQVWRPDRAPKAAISLVHGLGDHSGRYPYLVQAMTDAGYAVNAFDLRGHGRSGGPRVYTPSYEALLKDIDVHLENTRARFPGLPHVMYGHSFGGAQTLCYAMRRRPALTAVVASSPGLASGIKQPGAKVLAGRLLSRIAPTLRIPLGSPVSTLSTDTAWVSKSLQDPFFYGTLSARIAIEQLTANMWILAQTTFPLPILIQQGTGDRYADPDVNIAFARRLQGDVTLKVWEGLGHELHNELPRETVLAFVREWLDQRVAR